MSGLRGRRIVVLGMLTKIPVAGVIWQTLHYVLGLRQLGYDVVYVEAHGRTPAMLMDRPEDDGTARAVALVSRVMDAFGMAGRWCYQALHDDGRCYGMTRRELTGAYDSADALLNLHGATTPLPEHVAHDRLVFIETDPVHLQVELLEGRRKAIDFVAPHCALFSFAENLGRPGCLLPVAEGYRFLPTRQPVVLELWSARGATAGTDYRTIGNWRQPWREVRLDGRSYSWSKHQEFERFLDLPGRSGGSFELALADCPSEDRHRLVDHGWKVRDGFALSRDLDAYRRYILAARGEFTVAKEQNVALRTGWFSDRSATFLAAGRPVVTQDTGFGDVLPVGEGLFAVSGPDEAADAIATIEADPPRARRAASAIAREYFAADRVLGDLLAAIDVPPASRGRSVAAA